MADQAELTELERARRAVLDERARIARELHGVVAPHMSLMAIRGKRAQRLGALPDPEQVRAEFGTLSGLAPDALTRMQRLLGVFWINSPSAGVSSAAAPNRVVLRSWADKCLSVQSPFLIGDLCAGHECVIHKCVMHSGIRLH